MLRIMDDEEIYRCTHANATAMSKGDAVEPVNPFWDGYRMLKIVDKLEESDLAMMTPTGTRSEAVKNIEDFLCELVAVATPVVNVRANKDKIIDILVEECTDDANEVDAISEVSTNVDSESRKSVNMIELVDVGECRFPEEPNFYTREVAHCHIGSFNSRYQGCMTKLVGTVGTTRKPFTMLKRRPLTVCQIKPLSNWPNWYTPTSLWQSLLHCRQLMVNQ